MCGCLSCCPLLGTCPATQACAFTGNPTGDLLVHRPALNPLSHPSQGSFLLSNLPIIIHKYDSFLWNGHIKPATFETCWKTKNRTTYWWLFLLVKWCWVSGPWWGTSAGGASGTALPGPHLPPTPSALQWGFSPGSHHQCLFPATAHRGT